MIFASEDRDPTSILQYFGGLAIPAPLSFGDFVFWGIGPDRSPISVCIERKRVRDVINSILSGRLVNQVRRAREFHRMVFVIVEGIYRPSPLNGLIELRYGRNWVALDPPLPYRRLDNSLNTLEIVEGVIVKRTSDPQETAQVVIDLYHWWQTPPEEHSTSRDFYSGTGQLNGKQLSLLRRIAKELPGIGWELSDRVEKSFATVQGMLNATSARWQKIEDIGPKKAQSIVTALHTRMGKGED